MEASDATLRQIMRIVRQHVDQTTLERIVEELLDVPGNKSFQDSRFAFFMRSIERALDPDRIMNLGRSIPITR